MRVFLIDAVGDREQGWVVGLAVADDGAVGFDDNFLGGAIGYGGALLAPGVEL